MVSTTAMNQLSEGAGKGVRMNKIHVYTENRRGRDFVVGNVNGDSDRILQAMYKASFLPGTDRLFVVGDVLAYRTPGNAMAKVLAMTGFHPVLGHFETMLLEHIRNHGIDDDKASMHSALKWWHATSLGERCDIALAIARMPLAIELQSAEGRIGMVHADVPRGMSWDDFRSATRRGDALVVAHALASGRRARTRDTAGVAGIDQLMVGHVQPDVSETRLGNVRYIGSPGFEAGELSGPVRSPLWLHRIETPARCEMPPPIIAPAVVQMPPQRAMAGAA